ncbi:MAG: hypothetical protein KF768_04135 [Phycisphaeraceae bacterium]|nr:hypothetical protein [Phycisphaeraceae bacterium]
MLTHTIIGRSTSPAALLALAGAMLALSACADTGNSVKPLSSTAAAATAADEGRPDAKSSAVTLTPVAQPSPGPMPPESGGETRSAAPVPGPAGAPEFRVLDADRLRASTQYVVETATGAGTDRYWTDLLAQTLDETISESLAPAPTSADSDTAARAGVLLLRVRVSGGTAPNFANASCVVELSDSGRALATFADASAPARLSADRPDQSETDLGRAVVRFWAEDLAQRLDALRTTR